MKTIKLSLLLLLCSLPSFSQVGVGNTDPKATLDVSASNLASPTNADGILIPRIDNFPTTNPTVDQDGMMVFATGNGTPEKGFYYWDQSTSSWIGVGGATQINDLVDGKSDNDGSDNGSSLFLGIDAGANDDSTHNFNVGIGFQALQSNISSWGNTAVGYQTLQANTTGMNNTATGTFSLTSNNSGVDNSAFGNGTLSANTLGSFNSAIGYGSLNSNTNGSYNTALGYWTLLNNNSGSRNVALGSSSGYTNSTGSNNVFIGYQSGYFETGSEKLYIENSNSDSNSALIYGEFDTNILRTNGELQIGNPSTTGYAFPTSDGTNGQVMTTDGSGNITFQNVVGDGTGNDWSLSGNNSNSSNFLGTTNNLDLSIRTNNTEFLKVTTTGQLEFLNTSESIKIGQYAGEGTGGPGFSRNVFIGHEVARYQGSSSLDNIGIGHEALRSVTGSSNIAIGSNTLRDTNSSNNIAIGNSTLWKNDTGSTNTALGYVSLGENTTGSNNTAIGALAGRINVSGNNNTYLGNRSGYFSTGSSNVFIGYDSGSNELGDHKLYIANSNADADNALIYGEFDNAILRTNGSLQIGNPSVSGYTFPNVDGTLGQVMTTDGAGNVSFQDSYNGDSDWLEVGSTNAPNSLNDDKYTGGSLSIGKNTAAVAKVDIETNDDLSSLFLVNNTNTGSIKNGIINVVNGNTSPIKHGIVNTFNNNANGILEVGVLNNIESRGSINQVGYSNFYTTNSNNNNGYFIGFQNTVGDQHQGSTTGLLNSFISNSGSNSVIGVKNFIDATGGGNHYGSFTEINSSGSGAKYGHNVTIPTTSGGTHYGFYADVQKASGYAGYFIGRTSLGNTTSNRYTMPDSDGTNGQVLTTDGSGNTSWQNYTMPSLSLARIIMSSDQAYSIAGWQKINFDTVDFDLNTDFNTTTNQFVVSTTGYYRVNASWRSNTSSVSTGSYGIGIYVNGILERAKSFNHTGNGQIIRSINNVLALNAGDTVEIYINTSAALTISLINIAASFEIEQIR
ncbi:beta strand repeat-containing protein [Psychroserpens algicola]|uniref:C1q domain-containing protein n=1 Tax=Psychroserpens algicola TaxID=1719034 RepID=A0ABT0H9K0_9FLAO|nr:hypothetical protein [Psychroserpens algicola]MCK8481049.1 hypothetical protein [Psychroserpens algicola]